jgi:hypothetical protein
LIGVHFLGTKTYKHRFGRTDNKEKEDTQGGKGIIILLHNFSQGK